MNMRPEWALITGASSGIGLELAHVLASEGYNLVLVSQDEDRLRTVAQTMHRQYGVESEAVMIDLVRDDALVSLTKFLHAKKLHPDIVINNAGFGVYGELADTPWKDEQDLIALNITRLTEFTKHFGQEMRRRGSGTIMNVASIAAFFPGVRMDVYYASKAYVLSLTLAVAEELRPHGVRVHCLCPGPTHTGFQSRAHATRSRWFGRPADASSVAKAAYRGMRRGKLMIVPGWRNKLNIFLARFTPRAWLAPLVRRAD